MSKVKIQGKEYELRLDLGALETIEDEFGDAKSALKSRKFKILKGVFVAMANSARRYRGLPENISGNELKSATVAEIGELGEAVKEAQQESIRTETVGGRADDEIHDEVLEEIEAREEKKEGPGAV